MENINKKPIIIKSLIITVIILIVDQVSKVIVRKMIPLNSRIPVIDGFFNLVNVTNKGIAFGMLENFSTNQYKLFILVTLLAISILFYFYISFIKHEDGHFFVVYALAAIIGGAFGNFFDRIAFGHVTDFVHLYYRSFDWPAFNFADTCISLGAISLIVFLIFFPDKSEEINSEEQDA